MLFEERDPDLEQERLDGKYLLVRRQFELADGARIYIESHDQDLIGHFKMVKARLNPKCLSLTISSKTSATVEVAFETSRENYAGLKRALTVMIPRIELQNEVAEKLTNQG